MIRYETLIKAVAAIALVLLLAAGATPHAAELRPEQVYQQILPCVMTLEIQDKNGVKSSGTAFLAVKDGYAVTAWHVIDDAVKVTAKFADSAIYDVVGVVDKDEQKDLALIKLNLRGRPVSELFTDPPLVGSRAYVVGSPREFEFSISDGLISQVRTLEGFKQYQFTCPVSKGTSGSPVVNAEGKVVGVVSWSRKDSQNLNFATPASYISRLNASLTVVPWTVSSRVVSRKLVSEVSHLKEK